MQKPLFVVLVNSEMSFCVFLSLLLAKEGSILTNDRLALGMSKLLWWKLIGGSNSCTFH